MVVVVVVSSSVVTVAVVSERIGPNSVVDSEGASVSEVSVIKELLTTIVLLLSTVKLT